MLETLKKSGRNGALLTTTLAAVLFLGCSKTTPQASVLQSSGDGIIGGVAVVDGEEIAKATVAIYDTQEKTLCTGTILSNQIILTAAHCVNQANPKAMVLLFGTKLPIGATAAKPVVRQVIDARVNPRYNQVMAMFEQNQATDPDLVKEWGDVAVLKFKDGLPSGYQPAMVLRDPRALKAGMTVTLAGYGEIDGVKHLGSDRLNKVDVVLAEANFSPTEVLMDQRQGRGACHGDSGGPAYVNVNGRLFVFGVTSRGTRDPLNNCGAFAVYSSVPAFLPYLTKAAGELVSKTTPPKAVAANP